MNGAQLHLLLNHLPVIVPLVAVPVLSLGLLLGSEDTRKVALWLLLASSLAAIPAYLTGDQAEAVVKNYPNVNRALISRHEDSALVSMIALGLAGAASLALLGARRLGRRTPRGSEWAIVLAAVAAFGLMARTAHLGGKIRHEEIQTGDEVLGIPSPAGATQR